jgi:hypothetical protein
MDAQGKRTLKIGITVGLSLGAIVGLVGCGEQLDTDSVDGHHEFGLASSNGLGSGNGLFAANGIAAANGLGAANGLTAANGLSMNGLSAANGLQVANGLQAANGLMTTDAGRKTVAYLVRCALNSNDTLTKQDQNGQWYTFAGAIGLCPDWKWGAINDTNHKSCQNALSACLMAHINTAGVHVPIWLDAGPMSTGTPIGWGTNSAYPNQEGSFFGNIIQTGDLGNIGMSGITAPVGYFCEGSNFGDGVVAGRIGSTQGGTPYRNAFAGMSVHTCDNNNGYVTGQYSNGVYKNDGSKWPADGWQAIKAPGTNYVYQNGEAITVWRNPVFTPVFDATYRYTFMPMQASNMAMDVCNANTANGTCVQQYSSWGGDPQKFAMLNGGNGQWRIAMKINTAKCVVPNGSVASGTKMVVGDCNSNDNTQAFTVQADASGGFTFTSVANTSLCLDMTGNNGNNGSLLELYTCNGQSNQKFKTVAAY